MDFKELEGRTLISIERNEYDIIFTDKSLNRYRMYHSQDCCENVTIEDICGDLDDLIGSPILFAEESTNSDSPKTFHEDEYEDTSFTWTFYKLSTIKGHVTIRWYGSSNGYYSEGVDFELMDRDPSKLELALK